MTSLRLFLDTNIYILGAADSTTSEGQILMWLQQVRSDDDQIELLVSEELLNQITRVARRLTNKDQAGRLLDRILKHPKFATSLLRMIKLSIGWLKVQFHPKISKFTSRLKLVMLSALFPVIAN